MVHSCAKEELARAQSGVVRNDSAVAADILSKFAEKVQQACDIQAWHASPAKNKLLHEFYYGSLRTEKIQALQAKIPLLATNLMKSIPFQLADSILVRECDEKELGYLKTHSGTRVFVRVDLLYQYDGKWWVVDWKTGRSSAQDKQQLCFYALYVRLKYRVPRYEDICLYNEYLENERLTVSSPHEDLSPTIIYASQAMINGAIDFIGRSMNEMRAYLADPARNMPLPVEHFPPAADTRWCRYCNFQELCV